MVSHGDIKQDGFSILVGQHFPNKGLPEHRRQTYFKASTRSPLPIVGKLAVLTGSLSGEHIAVLDNRLQRQCRSQPTMDTAVRNSLEMG